MGRGREGLGRKVRVSFVEFEMPWNPQDEGNGNGNVELWGEKIGIAM